MNDTLEVLTPRRRRGAAVLAEIRSHGRHVVVFSDLHLGPLEPIGFPRVREAILVDVIRRATTRRDIIVLGGDIFDVIQARSTENEILQGYPSLRRALVRACEQTNVFFVRGNHDDQGDDGAPLRWTVCDVLRIDDSTVVVHGHVFDPLEKVGWANFVEKAWALTQGLVSGNFPRPTSLEGPLRLRTLQCILGVVLDLMLRGSERLGCTELAYRLRVLGDSLVSQSQVGDPMLLLRGLRRMMSELDDGISTIICGHSHAPGVVRIGELLYANAGTWTTDQAPVVRMSERDVVVEDAATGQRYGSTFYVGWETSMTWDGFWPERAHAIQPRTIARAILDVLPKRFGKYGLRLHPDERKLVDFRRSSQDPVVAVDEGPRRPGARDCSVGTMRTSGSPET